MKERGRRPKKPFELPGDHKLIFLEETDNVVALCKHKGCESIVFVGSNKTAIGNRVLNERLRDHRDFYPEPHEIDVIFPREKRVVDAEDYTAPQMTSKHIRLN